MDIWTRKPSLVAEVGAVVVGVDVVSWLVVLSVGVVLTNVVAGGDVVKVVVLTGPGIACTLCCEMVGHLGSITMVGERMQLDNEVIQR